MATTEAPPTAIPPDPEAGTGTLDERIARIAGSVVVHADKSMSTGGRSFGYASIDAMSAALAPLLAAEGVSIVPADVEVVESDILGREKTGHEGPYTQYRHMTVLKVTWRVSGAGESFTACSIGKSADPEGSEKDANQAHTFARVNLYKSMFHLVTGDDPEQKPAAASSGSSGAWNGSQGTGELPTMNDPAGVSGTVAVSEDGQKVGIKHRAEDRADFDAIKDAAKALGARWNGEAKLWELPAAKAETAVALGRHVGLSIQSALAERFPVKAADDLAPTQSDSGAPADDDDIPF